MTRIGIIGFGFMGRTHLEAYRADRRAQVVTIAEADPVRVQGDAAGGNIGDAKGDGDVGALDGVTIVTEAETLLDDDTIDAVSICVPTPLHADLAVAALERGRHVLVEKPLALSAREADRVVRAAEGCPALVCMPAMCMRFWPGWRWLREVIGDRRYGAVRSAVFTRLGAAPDWGRGFYDDPACSGGAILDLHIHDADFVRSCFGEPAAVEAVGSTGRGGGIDHVLASYRYPDGPGLVVAEGGWMSAPGFPFRMQYRVDFEAASAEFDSGADTPLVLHGPGGEAETVEIPAGMGYAGEVTHFLDLVEGREGRGTRPLVTIRDGAEAVRLVEAERRSIETGAPVDWVRGG